MVSAHLSVFESFNSIHPCTKITGIGLFSFTFNKYELNATFPISSVAVTESVILPVHTGDTEILCPVAVESPGHAGVLLSLAIDHLYLILLPHEPIGLALNVIVLPTIV